MQLKCLYQPDIAYWLETPLEILLEKRTANIKWLTFGPKHRSPEQIVSQTAFGFDLNQQ